MLLGSLMERSQVAALVGLGIQIGPETLSIEEERVVSRQSPRPQMPFVVSHVLFMVEYSFCLQKEIVIQIQIQIQIQEYIKVV